MQKKSILFCLILTVGFHSSWNYSKPDWGFYAHKKINRLAVFTVPAPLFGFYKKHIDYIAEHAVDADKRRYIDSLEAPRHYLDGDHYEHAVPFDTIPHNWFEAEIKYTKDTLTKYGIVPWHVLAMMSKLTKAFEEKNTEKILNYSADLGHYVADSHVPLHSSENYNGQLTNQHGIHGFWESRLPELFSDEYDLFTGKAQYIENLNEFSWNAITGSFAALDSVLSFERKLNEAFREDRKYAIEARGNVNIKVYSKEYSQAYHEALDGQVEKRMKSAIWAVGCFWYTAWINAGSPDIDGVIYAEPITEKEGEIINNEKMIGRQEINSRFDTPFYSA